MKGVILHGGSGTRLRPLTYTDVKQLLPVGGKPVSQYALENLIELGIKDINIIVGEVGEKEVKEYYTDGSRWNVNISYTYQEKPLGIAHAISLVENFTEREDFVVVLGDNYFQNGLRALLEDFNRRKPDALVALTKVDEPWHYGIATVQNGKIVKMQEKPKKPDSNLAVTGAYFLRDSIFNIIKGLKPSWRNELEITDAFQNMIESGMNVSYVIIDGWWKDTGTVNEFLDCNRMVLDKINRKVDASMKTVNISGRTYIGESVLVDHKSKVLGPCFIGSNSKIENSYVGPYTSIGNNCHLKNVEIEDSVVMDGSRIEISNGTRISQSLIGANTIIRPNGSNSKRLSLFVGRDSVIEL